MELGGSDANHVKADLERDNGNNLTLSASSTATSPYLSQEANISRVLSKFQIVLLIEYLPLPSISWMSELSITLLELIWIPPLHQLNILWVREETPQTNENRRYLSHPKISILGCEYLFEYNYPSFEYFENFPEFSGINSHFFLELNPINGKF